MSDFVTVAAYTNIVNARIAKSVLDQHGIFALIANEHIADMNLPGVHGVTGIELRVRPSDADAAALLVADDTDGEEISACPRCGSNKISRANSILLGVFMDILGLSTRDRNARRRCKACGHDWPAQASQ